MKKLEVFFIFIGIAVTLASITVPLWWDKAQPYIYELPGYIEKIISDITYIIHQLIDAVQKNI